VGAGGGKVKDTAKLFEDMTTEELENTLPLVVQKDGQQLCPCCKNVIVSYGKKYDYEQELFRCGEKNHRVYEITYRLYRHRDIILFSTGIRGSIREALIEAHKTLASMGLHPEVPKGGA
jgi:hypothetical protein